MKSFFMQFIIQFKLEVRDKAFIRFFYIVPLVFYLAVGVMTRLLGIGDSGSLTVSMTICVLTMSAYLGAPQMLVWAKENGTLHTYRAAGMPPWSMPLINIIISLGHMIITSIFVLVTSPLLFSGRWPESITLHLFSVAFVALCLLGYATLLSFFVNNKVLLIVAGLVLFLPTVLYEGVIFTSGILPKVVQVICELLPPIHGMRLMADPGFSAGPFIVLLLLSAAVFYGSFFLYGRISGRD